MDKDLIEEKLIYLKKLLNKLKDTLKIYDNSPKEKELIFLASTKLVEEIIEISIKINNILLREKGDIALTYSKSFTYLTKHFDIDEKKISLMAKAANLRNRVTHEYGYFLENKDETMKKYKEIFYLFEDYKNMILKIIK